MKLPACNRFIGLPTYLFRLSRDLQTRRELERQINLSLVAPRSQIATPQAVLPDTSESTTVCSSRLLAPITHPLQIGISIREIPSDDNLVLAAGNDSPSIKLKLEHAIGL